MLPPFLISLNKQETHNIANAIYNFSSFSRFKTQVVHHVIIYISKRPIITLLKRNNYGKHILYTKIFQDIGLYDLGNLESYNYL